MNEEDKKRQQLIASNIGFKSWLSLEKIPEKIMLYTMTTIVKYKDIKYYCVLYELMLEKMELNK